MPAATAKVHLEPEFKEDLEDIIDILSNQKRIKLEADLAKLYPLILESEDSSPDKKQLNEIASIIEKMIVRNKDLKADIVLPPMEDMNVRLVRSDTLDRLNEYRADESKAHLLIGAFGGAILGILSNWATNENFIITRPSIVLMSFILMLIVASILWAYQINRRAQRILNRLIFPKETSKDENFTITDNEKFFGTIKDKIETLQKDNKISKNQAFQTKQK